MRCVHAACNSRAKRSHCRRERNSLMNGCAAVRSGSSSEEGGFKDRVAEGRLKPEAMKQTGTPIRPLFLWARPVPSLRIDGYFVVGRVRTNQQPTPHATCISTSTTYTKDCTPVEPCTRKLQRILENQSAPPLVRKNGEKGQKKNR